MKSSKHGGATAEENRGISGKLVTLHQRLYHALNLGFRRLDNRWKWHCADVEIQRLVLRSIDSFLDCILSETVHHPLVKDSVDDMLEALGSILQSKSESVLGLASNLAVKMVQIFPSLMQKSHILILIYPLASLLPTQQQQVAVSCATALNCILSNLSSRQEKDVWRILEETESVGCLVRNVKKFLLDEKPVEYFTEMSSLLCKILWRWPACRFSVWSDSQLLNILDTLKHKPENSVKVVVLRLYSSLALCGYGADKLLENGEALTQIMVDSMGAANPQPVQMEGYRLARCLTSRKSAFLQMSKLCCEALSKVIVCGMNNWCSHPEKFVKNQMSLVQEACQLAVITCWEGDHHKYLWQFGINRVLLNLLLGNFRDIEQSWLKLSMEERTAMLQECLNANFCLFLRPYVWDILGGLANHAESSKLEIQQNEVLLNILIMSACLVFVDSIHAARKVSQSNLLDKTEVESASRAVLRMLYSSCTPLASLSRFILTEILKTNEKDYVVYCLNTLRAVSSSNKFGTPSSHQLAINLISLACCSSLPRYRELIIKHKGVITLCTFTKWWLSNPIYIKRSSIAPHLHDSFFERSCCSFSTEDWEGEDMLLLFSLWSIAELLHHSGLIKTHLFDNNTNITEAELVGQLQQICRSSSAPGPRYYAAYALSYFGLYGFPSKLGDRIGKALHKNEHSDLELSLVNQESVYVHGVILLFRCPSLLPPGVLHFRVKPVMQGSDKRIMSVRLSAHVDRQSLLNLLEYIYLGYLQAGEDLLKKLKIFAKHCKLEPLLQMLSGRNPKWGAPIPSFDLTPALMPAGHHFSDVILEANTIQLLSWKCGSCSVSIPHFHAHKVILESSCDYLRALFGSGMQESYVQTIKVPVSWDSLTILVSWFYSEQLVKPNFGCIWDNLEAEEKQRIVEPYIELCWLSEFWVMKGFQEQCYEVVLSCLDSSRQLASKILKVAAQFSQWKLAEVAADYVAPLYHHLRSSNELDALDEHLIEMVRCASVRLSQESSHQY